MSRFVGALRAPQAAAWITGLAFVVRVILVIGRRDWASPEAWEYGIVAQNLLAGHGFAGSAWFVPEGPTAFMAPVYVFMLYGALLIFGGAGYAVLQIVQAAIGAASVWLLHRLSARFVSVPVASVAALILAFHPTHAYLATVIHPLVLITFTLLATLASLAWFREKPNKVRLCTTGILYGFALLTDPAILCIGPVIVLALFTRLDLPIAHRAGWTAAVLCIAVAVVSPWTMRNYLVFERFIPVKSQLGYILWVGNHEGATGTQTILREDGTVGHINERLPESLVHELSEMPEPEAYSTLGKIAAEYIRAHPVETAVRSLKKAGYYWVFPYWHVNPVDRDAPYRAHVRRPEELLWFIVLIPAIVGLVVHRDRLLVALFTLMPCACYTALYALTNVGSNPRYRIPIEPLVMVWAAIALYWLAHRATKVNEDPTAP